jgi:hypothetical protein
MNEYECKQIDIVTDSMNQNNSHKSELKQCLNQIKTNYKDLTNLSTIYYKKYVLF